MSLLLRTGNQVSRLAGSINVYSRYEGLNQVPKLSGFGGLAFGTQVRGFKPDRSRRIFKGEKILSTPYLGGEVKPSVPCLRFTACKRLLNATWKSGISSKIHRPFLAQIVLPLATRISTRSV